MSQLFDLSRFPDFPPEVVKAFEAASAPDPEKKAPRKPSKTRALPAQLSRVERVMEPGSILCPCGCGDMVRIGEDRTERLDYIPARYQVIVTICPKSTCPKGRAGVVQAKAPANLLVGSWPGTCRSTARRWSWPGTAFRSTGPCWDAIRGSAPDHRRAVRRDLSRPLLDEFFAWLAAWARFASLIGSCKMNGVESYAYLCDLFKGLAGGHLIKDIDALMPWASATASQPPQ